MNVLMVIIPNKMVESELGDENKLPEEEREEPVWVRDEDKEPIFKLVDAHVMLTDNPPPARTVEYYYIGWSDTGATTTRITKQVTPPRTKQVRDVEFIADGNVVHYEEEEVDGV